MKQTPQKHKPHYPSARNLRRTCRNELYRTIKRLKLYVPPEQLEAAEKLYFKKVALHLHWIVENKSNRKLLCDWWDEAVSEEIAALWQVEPNRLRSAFRQAFGG